MIKKVRYLFLLTFVFVIFSTSSWASLTQAYIGGAFMEKKSSFNYSKKNSDIKNNFNSNAYSLNIGVRPLDILILGGFRVEGQYSGYISGENKSSQWGATVYYDLFRFIPIVNPYLGFGIQRSHYDFDKNIFGKREKESYSFNAGLTASIPLLPLDLYLEYRHLNTNKKSYTESFSYKISSNDLMIGIRYYVF